MFQKSSFLVLYRIKAISQFSFSIQIVLIRGSCYILFGTCVAVYTRRVYLHYQQCTQQYTKFIIILAAQFGYFQLPKFEASGRNTITLFQGGIVAHYVGKNPPLSIFLMDLLFIVTNWCTQLKCINQREGKQQSRAVSNVYRIGFMNKFHHLFQFINICKVHKNSQYTPLNHKSTAVWMKC